MNIIITAPSLDTQHNVSGISSVANFIIESNSNNKYIHFKIGKRDDEKRNVNWLIGFINLYFRWIYLMVVSKNVLVHFNFAIDKFSILRDAPLILIAKLFRKRMIYHLHGGEFSLEKKLPLWMKCILKIILSGKNPKIVLSPLDRDFIRSQFNCDRIFILSNCVSLDEASNFNRVISKYEKPVLLFMGRITLNKGIEYIFRALESLKNQQQDFKFILAGKGPEMNRYVKKFSDLLGVNFTYTGVVSGVRKTKLLMNCNVFLLPSFFEGLPISLLESMSFGMVPITTNVGSIKYLIKNNTNGIIVNKFSSEDIVNAIKRISLDREFTQKLSTNAKEYIFDNYSPTKYIDRLNEIYNYN